VNEQNQATVRDIVLGPVEGSIQAIAKGLQPGERVILEGVDRLREGRNVTVVEDQPEPAKKAPAPKSGGEPTKKRKSKGT
jgi:multidrug efflux system membrane fusion protein